MLTQKQKKEYLQFKKKYRIQRRVVEDMSAYKKLELLGKGTYGQVFKALHLRIKKVVAIKQIKKIEDEPNQGISPIFLKQLSILRRLDHPNIIKLLNHSIDEHNVYAFAVLEYMPSDLGKQLKKGPLSITNTKYIIKQLLNAIKYCHQKYIIHRDIKPSNIMYHPQTKHIKLGDFGISKFIYTNLYQHTPQVGSLYYKAPQLIYQDKKYNYNIDIWAIGCVFVECLLGKILFKADYHNQIRQLCAIAKVLELPYQILDYNLKDIQQKYNQLKQKRIEQAIPKLRYLLPREGLDLLNKMLAFNPKNRITAAQALQHPYFRTKKKQIPKKKFKIRVIREVLEKYESDYDQVQAQQQKICKQEQIIYEKQQQIQEKQQQIQQKQQQQQENQAQIQKKQQQSSQSAEAV